MFIAAIRAVEVNIVGRHGYSCSSLQPRLRPANLFVPMLTKELSPAERIPPAFIEPMYAEAVRELPDGTLWTYEAKLDGYRCLAARRSNGVVLWSRRGNGFTDRFPQIAKACEKLPVDTLIDGEVIAIDESGKASFNALQH